MPDAGADAHGERVLQVFGDGGEGVRAFWVCCWWVNQNQTYRHEMPGGYLWSPKRKSNDGVNPFILVEESKKTRNHLEFRHKFRASQPTGQKKPSQAAKSKSAS